MRHRSWIRDSQAISGVLLLCGFAAAQSTEQATPIQGAVRDAGIYHVATGTWTRPGAGTANFGPNAIYSNSTPVANVWQNQSPGRVAVDEGGVPRIDNTVLPGTKNGYTVNGFQIAYCTYNTAGPMFNFRFYGGYNSCANPTAGGSPTGPISGTVSTVGMGLPATGAQGTMTCWTITIDLENTTAAFCLEADGGDDSYDGGATGTPTDLFGWSFEQLQTNGATNPATGAAIYDGLIISGDPNNTMIGDGTSFGTVGSPGTGLLTQDEFWISAPTAGCTYFGGYANGAVYGSFYLRLFSDFSDPDCAGAPSGPVGANNCNSLPSSTGLFASLTGFGNTSLSANDLVLTCADMPPNVNAVFYYGTGTPASPPLFGNGLRCVVGMIQRFRLGNSANAAGTMIGDAFDPLQNPQSNVPLVAGTLYFQTWFRDPMGGGAGFNTSNGLEITLTP